MLKISPAPGNPRATSKVCAFPIDRVGLSLLDMFMKHMNWLPHCGQGAAVSIPGLLEGGEMRSLSGVTPWLYLQLPNMLCVVGAHSQARGYRSSNRTSS